MSDVICPTVLILAGGLGTRLRPLTLTVPKPMVPVAGVPYLAHQLRVLRDQGLTDVVISTGYLGHMVEEYFEDGAAFGVSIRYSPEPEPIGTGGAIRLAAPLLTDQFVVLYGDSFLPISYADTVRRLDESGADAVLVVLAASEADTDVSPNIAVDGDGFVTRYAKNGIGTDLTHIDAGVLAFRTSALQSIPDHAPVSLENDAFPRLIDGRRLASLATSQRFYDIGTPSRLAALERALT